jgi:hypothetical protein
MRFFDRAIDSIVSIIGNSISAFYGHQNNDD